MVAPDLRGYNTSSKPKDIENYGRCSVVSDMVHLIDELGGGKPATVVSVSFTMSLISLPGFTKVATLTFACSADHSEIFAVFLL